MTEQAASQPQPYVLGVLERVLLVELLHGFSGLAMETMLIERFIQEVALSEQEMVDWEWGPEPGKPGTMRWNPDKAIPLEFVFSEWRLAKVRALLTAMNERGGVGAVSLEWLALFRIFAPELLIPTDPALLAEYAALTGKPVEAIED